MEKTLPDVFLRRAQGIGHILRDRGIYRMQGFGGGEPLTAYLYDNPDGSNRLMFRRSSDGDAAIQFNNMMPGDLDQTHFGEETILSAELIGSSVAVIDNRAGVADVDVDFRETFSEEDSKEKAKEKSAGTSVSVSVEAEEGIEGIASFKESVEAEAHAEISESESDTSTDGHTSDDDERTTVPVGMRVRITQNRRRADTSIHVTAHGPFTHDVTVGKHSGGHFVSGRHGRGKAHWDTWDQFEAVIHRDAPANWDLAESFAKRGPWHADLWALDPLNSGVAYTLKYQGRVLYDYTVTKF